MLVACHDDMWTKKMADRYAFNSKMFGIFRDLNIGPDFYCVS